MTFCGQQARQSTLNFDALRIGGHKIDTQSDFRQSPRLPGISDCTTLMDSAYKK